MIVRVDGTSPVPPYAQIQEQITTMARSRVLVAGARLPAIRHLAADLGVAAGTVARAYRELEANGVVATRGRHGTVVRDPGEWAASSATVERGPDGESATPTDAGTQGPPMPVAPVRAAADALALEATHRGLDLDGALDAVRAAFGRLHDRPEPA